MPDPAPGADPLAALLGLPGVFEAVDAARGSVDALLRDLRSPALRPHVAAVTAESLRRSAWASGALAGRAGDLDDYAAPVSDMLGANTFRLYAGLAAVAETWRTAPLQALARMHAVAATGLAPEDALGRPASTDAAVRLEQLGGLVTGPTAAPAVVVAAVVHGEILATRAFGPGSDLVARAAARCVEIDRGLDPRAVTIPEVGLLELGSSGYDAATEAYATGTPDGVAAWLVHWAQAVAAGARAGRGVAEDVAAAAAAAARAGGAPSVSERRR